MPHIPNPYRIMHAITWQRDLPSVADTVRSIEIAVIPVSVAHTCTGPSPSEKLVAIGRSTVTAT